MTATAMLAECKGRSVLGKTVMTATTVLADCQSRSVEENKSGDSVTKAGRMARPVGARKGSGHFSGKKVANSTTTPAGCQGQRSHLVS